MKTGSHINDDQGFLYAIVIETNFLETNNLLIPG